MPHTSDAAPTTTTLAVAPLGATAVLLDLDGTITDSAPAITRSIAETLATFGYREQSPEELLRFVGPPIRTGFTELAEVPAGELEDAVTHYRAVYAARMLEVDVYPGVSELITTLHAAGTPLAVATSKVREMAVAILEHAGLAQYFTIICGATLDESRSKKADIVTDALAGLAAAGADTTSAVMVGDRHHDVEGAAANGIPVVLAGWGYGRPGEESGAHAVVHDTTELAAVLGAAGGAHLPR